MARNSLRLTACLAAVLMSVCAQAQPGTRPSSESGRDDKTGKGSIRGRVVDPSGVLVNQSVKISLSTVNGLQSTIYTDNQGWFEFPDLVPGNYEVQAESAGPQFQIVSQSVQVYRGAPSQITLSLIDKNTSSKRNGKSALSVGEFGADVPKNARKEFELASKATQAQRSDEAIAHLRKAISLYPNFVMARNDLGIQLLAQGKLEEAAEQLRQACLIDPKAFNPKLNLGIVLVQEHQFSEASDVLARAVSLDPQSAAARLYAGLAQLGLGNLADAEKDLKTAYSIGGASYSIALFHLGQLYMNRGDREQALQAFQGYLRDSPEAANSDQVRKLIAMLR